MMPEQHHDDQVLVVGYRAWAAGIAESAAPCVYICRAWSRRTKSHSARKITPVVSSS
jgi:hypothetical protein